MTGATSQQRIPIDTRLSASITSDDHVQGPIDAAVTLVQYGDYACPYTRMSRHSVHQLQREYPDRLRFVFRHFPLEAIHPHARSTATAAEAAGAQTDFGRMHEYLFEHQKAHEGARQHHPFVRLLVRLASEFDRGHDNTL